MQMRAAAVVEGVLAIDQHAPDAVARQHQRRGHADRAGADDQRRGALPWRRRARGRAAPQSADSRSRANPAVPCRQVSCAALRLSLAVEKSLHQPLRLAGQEGLPEHADAEVDGLRQRQFFPLPQQRLLRAQRFRTAFEQRLDRMLDRGIEPALLARPRRPGPRRARSARRCSPRSSPASARGPSRSAAATGRRGSPRGCRRAPPACRIWRHARQSGNRRRRRLPARRRGTSPAAARSRARESGARPRRGRAAG